MRAVATGRQDSAASVLGVRDGWRAVTRGLGADGTLTPGSSQGSRDPGSMSPGQLENREMRGWIALFWPRRLPVHAAESCGQGQPGVSGNNVMEKLIRSRLFNTNRVFKTSAGKHWSPRFTNVLSRLVVVS